MACTETLPFLLKSLKLSAIANQWHELASTAENNHWSYGNFLAMVMDLECTLRAQKSWSALIKMQNFL